MGGVASYIYSVEEMEIPIDKNERISYVTEREIKLIKSSEDKYYTIYEQGYLTEKKIPRGSYFTISKILKKDSGNIRILVQFDQELELIDMTGVFSGINPISPRTGWIRDVLTTSLFLPSNSRSRPLNTPYQNVSGGYPNSY